MAQAAGSPGVGGSQLWAPGASAACSGTARAQQGVFVGRQRGNALLNPLPGQQEGRAGAKGHLSPASGLGKRISGLGMGILHPHLHTACKGMSLPSHSSNKTLFHPRVTEATSPCPEEGLQTLRAVLTHKCGSPSVLTVTHNLSLGKAGVHKDWSFLSEQDALLWNWAVLQRGQSNPKGQQHN